jgi:hypothetical protein
MVKLDVNVLRNFIFKSLAANMYYYKFAFWFSILLREYQHKFILNTSSGEYYVFLIFIKNFPLNIESPNKQSLA